MTLSSFLPTVGWRTFHASFQKSGSCQFLRRVSENILILLSEIRVSRCRLLNWKSFSLKNLKGAAVFRQNGVGKEPNLILDSWYEIFSVVFFLFSFFPFFSFFHV